MGTMVSYRGQVYMQVVTIRFKMMRRHKREKRRSFKGLEGEATAHLEEFVLLNVLLRLKDGVVLRDVFLERACGCFDGGCPMPNIKMGGST